MTVPFPSRRRANELPPLTRRRAAVLFDGDDTGAATAEYAVTTMATVAPYRHV